MSPTIEGPLIGAVAILAAAVLAYFGSRHIPRAQRENLAADTARSVIETLDTASQALIKRIADLEAEVGALKTRYAESTRELERARGEATELRAENGTLRATLAAKEIELAGLRAQLAASPIVVAAPSGGDPA